MQERVDDTLLDDETTISGHSRGSAYSWSCYSSNSQIHFHTPNYDQKSGDAAFDERSTRDVEKGLLQDDIGKLSQRKLITIKK